MLHMFVQVTLVGNLLSSNSRLYDTIQFISIVLLPKMDEIAL